VLHEDVKFVKVLSKDARAHIKERTAAHEFDNRRDESEPPFMAPSVDPDLYSNVSVNCLHL
jgi:hypothetical protein